MVTGEVSGSLRQSGRRKYIKVEIVSLRLFGNGRM